MKLYSLFAGLAIFLTHVSYAEKVSGCVPPWFPTEKICLKSCAAIATKYKESHFECNLDMPLTFNLWYCNLPKCFKFEAKIRCPSAAESSATTKAECEIKAHKINMTMDYRRPLSKKTYSCRSLDAYHWVADEKIILGAEAKCVAGPLKKILNTTRI